MGTKNPGNVVSLLFLLLCSVLVSNCSSKFFDPVTVQIQNEIEGDDIKLEAECWSNDDDLGTHTLAQGERWDWQFRVVPFFTHFQCNFRWYDNTWYFRWYEGDFDVYNAHGIINRYKFFCELNCQWSYRRDGAYLYRRDHHEWELRDVWN
ncbi:hypothetical protein MKW92_005913 [Papaver armeniacum]|nr:hypothetical protein MKW92_005913 [Papaver armeniacum]